MREGEGAGWQKKNSSETMQYSEQGGVRRERSPSRLRGRRRLSSGPRTQEYPVSQLLFAGPIPPRRRDSNSAASYPSHIITLHNVVACCVSRSFAGRTFGVSVPIARKPNMRDDWMRRVQEGSANKKCIVKLRGALKRVVSSCRIHLPRISDRHCPNRVSDILSKTKTNIVQSYFHTIGRIRRWKRVPLKNFICMGIIKTILVNWKYW